MINIKKLKIDIFVWVYNIVCLVLYTSMFLSIFYIYFDVKNIGFEFYLLCGIIGGVLISIGNIIFDKLGLIKEVDKNVNNN